MTGVRYQALRVASGNNRQEEMSVSGERERISTWDGQTNKRDTIEY